MISYLNLTHHLHLYLSYHSLSKKTQHNYYTQQLKTLTTQQSRLTVHTAPHRRSTQQLEAATAQRASVTHHEEKVKSTGKAGVERHHHETAHCA